MNTYSYKIDISFTSTMIYLIYVLWTTKHASTTIKKRKIKKKLAQDIQGINMVTIIRALDLPPGFIINSSHCFL